MRSRLVMFSLFLAVPLVACAGDDGVGPTGDSLTEAEAAALAEYMVGQGLEQGFSGYQGGGTIQSPARAPFTYEENFSTTVECPLGGTVAVSASFTASGDTEVEGDLTLDYTLSQTHDDCAVVPEGTDTEFTLNALNDDPTGTLEFVVELTDGNDVTAEGSLNGAVAWATDDDRSGTCPINLDYTLDADLSAETGSAMLTGTICAADISRSIDIGGDAL